MNKKVVITVLYILGCVSLLEAKTSRQVLLRDGLVLRGIVGKLIADNNDVWTFELSSPVDDSGSVLDAGTKLELLLSSGLEMMIEDVKTHTAAAYQLWNAKVTKYKGKNYLFPSIFIRVSPLSGPKISGEEDSKKSVPVEIPSTEGNVQSSASIDSNDILSLPAEVIEKFNAARKDMVGTGQRMPDSNIVTIDNVQQEIEKIRRLNIDTVLLEKSAVLVRHDKEGFEFALDSIGRNIDKTSLRLLSCEVLEQTEVKQSASPEPLRFQISGIVTKYKGNDYILLYKAAQIYSQGNFGK